MFHASNLSHQILWAQLVSFPAVTNIRSTLTTRQRRWQSPTHSVDLTRVVMRQVQVKTMCDVTRISHDSLLYFFRFRFCRDRNEHQVVALCPILASATRFSASWLLPLGTNTKLVLFLLLPLGTNTKPVLFLLLPLRTNTKLVLFLLLPLRTNTKLVSFLLLPLRTNTKLTFRQSWCCFYCFP